MSSPLPDVTATDLSEDPSETPTRFRYVVLVMLCSLSFVLYLDRVCISQAANYIEHDLHLTKSQMSYVFSAFLVAYGLFEIPTGHWGDRFGSRSVLTRIVLWWSAFTMLTGLCSGLLPMIIVRFLFGAGEAGALPNAARVVRRWFPSAALGRAQGFVVGSTLVGGAAAPPVAQYLINQYGWRWSFAALGLPGVVWAIGFYAWYRDDPAEHPSVNDQERRLIGIGRPVAATAEPVTHVPWLHVLTSANIWLLGFVVTCAAATTYLFFSWYPSYLQNGRGVSPEASAWMSSTVLTGGALGSMIGGWVCDILVRRTGDRRWTRSLLGASAMATAGLAMFASVNCDSPWISAACCTWSCFAIYVQLSAWWGVVSDISGKHLGTIFGLVNSMGILGGVASPILLGWSVDRLKNLGHIGRAQWDPAFYVYGGVLLCGAVMWLWINANKSAVEPIA